MTETLLNTITSAKQYKRILRIMFINMQKKTLTGSTTKDEISDLWSSIEEIAKIKTECTCYLIAIQVESLSAIIEESAEPLTSGSLFTVNEMFERVIRQFVEIANLIQSKQLDARSKKFDVIDTVLEFLNGCQPAIVLKYKDYFTQLIDTLFSSSVMLYKFMQTENYVVQLFQKCFTPEKKIIILHLMERLFNRIQFNEDDDNFDAELRKRVFHCLRKYTESFKQSSENIDARFIRKVFSFVVRFYITLIEEGKIVNFEDFFEATCQFYHQESIFQAKVYSPIVI